MASNAIGLTDAKLKGLKSPAAGQLEYCDQAVPGLRVRIGVSGARTFVLRKRVAGKPRNITLGRYSERFGLADARKKARALLSAFEHGADPVAALPQTKKRNATELTVLGMSSEERRVGKESDRTCRARGTAVHQKQKKKTRE